MSIQHPQTSDTLPKSILGSSKILFKLSFTNHSYSASGDLCLIALSLISLQLHHEGPTTRCCSLRFRFYGPDKKKLIQVLGNVVGISADVRECFKLQLVTALAKELHPVTIFQTSS